MTFVLLIALAASGFLCGAAHAGSWEKFYLYQSPNFDYSQAYTTQTITTVINGQTSTSTWMFAGGGEVVGISRLDDMATIASSENATIYELWVPNGESDTDSRFISWSPGSGNPFASDPAYAADPPPQTHIYGLLNLSVSNNATYYYSRSVPDGLGFSLTGSADDGYNDQYTTASEMVSGQGYNDSSGQSAGLHLVQQDGSSGVLTFPFNPTANMTMTVTDPNAAPNINQGGSLIGNSTYSGSWLPDSRGAAITSDLPNPTYHKGPNDGNGNATRVADAAGSDGTVTANIVNGDPGVAPTIMFTGYAVGPFDVNSAFNMNSVASGYNNSGTFSGPGAVTTLFADYDPAVTQEHVYLHLTDSADNANATANYYVIFHQPWENFVPDPNQTPTPNLHRFLSSVGVEGPTPGAAWNATITATATLTASLTGGMTVPDLANFGITLGGSFSSTFGVGISDTSPSIDLHYERFPYVDVTYNTNHYLVDHYVTAGFDATYPESVDDKTPNCLLGWTDPEERVPGQ